MNGVKLVKGMRYMTNTATKDKDGKSPIFPYSQERIDRCPSLKEIHPVFEDIPEQEVLVEDADGTMKAEPSLRLEEPAFTLEEPVVIEELVITAEQQKKMAEKEPDVAQPQKAWKDMTGPERAAYRASKKGK